MIKLRHLSALAASVAALAVWTASPANAQFIWEPYGDWEITVISDDMDPIKKVYMRTGYLPDPNEQLPSRDVLAFGFLVAGPEAVAFLPRGTAAKVLWPYCELNRSSYAVDGSAPKFISTLSAPAHCNMVDPDGQTIRDFSGGKTARVKIREDVRTISLKGFSAALARARQLSR